MKKRLKRLAKIIDKQAEDLRALNEEKLSAITQRLRAEEYVDRLTQQLSLVRREQQANEKEIEHLKTTPPQYVQQIADLRRELELAKRGIDLVGPNEEAWNEALLLIEAALRIAKPYPSITPAARAKAILTTIISRNAMLMSSSGRETLAVEWEKHINWAIEAFDKKAPLVGPKAPEQGEKEGV